MDLDDIRIFTKVVEAGSFTKAARLLAIPKSTVSRRVGELEDRLGVLLLQRTTRRLSLTHAGEVYFSRTSHIVEELRLAETALSELATEPRGTLKLTTPSDLIFSIPDLVFEFQKKYPEIELIVLPTNRRVDLVAEGFDVALRGAVKLVDSSLVSRQLLKSNMALFASPEYLEKHGTPTTPEDLVSHNCLIFSSDRLDAVWTLDGPEKSHEVPVRGNLATQEFELIRSAAVRGLGIAYMPELTAAWALHDGRLERILPEFRSMESNLYAVYPSPRHLSPKVRAFIDFAADWFQQRMTLCHRKCDKERREGHFVKAPPQLEAGAPLMAG